MSRDAHPDYPEFRLIKRKEMTIHRNPVNEEELKNSLNTKTNNKVISESTTKREKSPLIPISHPK
jgi:hypothetical protein